MVWIGLGVLAVSLLWMWNAKKKPIPTAQDVLGSKETKVSWDGMTERDNLFRMVVEVEPINSDHASLEEHKAIWTNFLGLVNTLSLPYKFVLQSQLFEMKDYTQTYDASVEQLSDHYPALKASGRDVSNYLTQSLEQDAIRDYRGYVIFEYDPIRASSVNGIQVGIGKVDATLGKIGSSGNRISDEEKSELALQILEEAADTLYGFCEQVGMKYQRLDRAGIWNYSYQMLQRELSPQARMIDALQSESFKQIKRSLTVESESS
ncbi:hypothetical protein ASL14_18995 [Paenibacillus sp. IHB B 3084]|uniref:hypothetical protein n=1 Tax=Paenibacillus sp. IHB B 3084 TaxID=867076 RepID=UPI000720D8A7|nr:hypothetical protein [Paenibacillus sp. IHB B 3084]ALP37961.1 hypothetical protein ASL14_18995 [Paenibacillus sp. IHB B 3084]